MLKIFWYEVNQFPTDSIVLKLETDRGILNSLPLFWPIYIETTLLAIYAQILALKPVIFYNWFQKNCAKWSGFNETGDGFH